MPFGCLVSHLPSPTKLTGSVGTWNPSAREGILAAYDIQPGYRWSGRYLVWDLRDFHGISLQRDEGFQNIGFRSPHYSSRVELYNGQLVFPLKARYDSRMLRLRVLTRYRCHCLKKRMLTSVAERPRRSHHKSRKKRWRAPLRATLPVPMNGVFILIRNWDTLNMTSEEGGTQWMKLAHGNSWPRDLTSGGSFRRVVVTVVGERESKSIG